MPPSHCKLMEANSTSKGTVQIWYPQFRERYPKLRKSFLKAVDRARKSFEASDIKDITKFFSGLQDIIYQYRISPLECWNEDKCGLRIGCLQEHIQVLVVYTTRSQYPEVSNPANRESYTQLAENNYTDQYNALEAQRKEHNDTLKQETQILFSQAQEEARRAYRPTLAINPNAWPPSNEVVQFTGITTFEDDDDDDIELIGLQDQQEEDIPDLATPPEMTSSPPISPVDLPSSQHHDFATTLPPPAPIRRQTRYQGIMRILREPRGQ
ncbi:hypothetical protein BKA56DRAFT_677464 [Ilyonectria sp. MPI-CAGE-AT-0026]|nr:hypothetical protein BKA56DRAFT_677464 [Ilyonectria sp. MPI-CAGE-AT-0026]